MRKAVFIAALLTTIMLASCGTDKNKEFITRFATAVTNGDKATLEKMYAASAKADSIATFVADSAVIEPNEKGDTILVKLGSSITFTMVKDANDSLQIISSKGLFAYAQDRLDFAKSTGWYADDLDDVQNAERLADSLFVPALTQKVAGDARTKVHVTKKDSHVSNNFERVTCTVIVANDNDFEVAGSDYSVKAALYNFYSIMVDELKWENFEQLGDSRVLTGKPIPAHGTAIYNYTMSATGRPGDPGTLRCSINVNLSPASIMAVYKPTGNEYEEYLKTK